MSKLFRVGTPGILYLNCADEKNLKAIIRKGRLVQAYDQIEESPTEMVFSNIIRKRDTYFKILLVLRAKFVLVSKKVKFFYFL